MSDIPTPPPKRRFKSLVAEMLDGRAWSDLDNLEGAIFDRLQHDGHLRTVRGFVVNSSSFVYLRAKGWIVECVNGKERGKLRICPGRMEELAKIEYRLEILAGKVTATLAKPAA